VIVTASTTDQINTLNFQTAANKQNYFYKIFLTEPLAKLTLWNHSWHPISSSIEQ
jgi:hypothetical protein